MKIGPYHHWPMIVESEVSCMGSRAAPDCWPAETTECSEGWVPCDAIPLTCFRIRWTIVYKQGGTYREPKHLRISVSKAILQLHYRGNLFQGQRGFLLWSIFYTRVGIKVILAIAILSRYQITAVLRLHYSADYCNGELRCHNCFPPNIINVINGEIAFAHF